MNKTGSAKGQTTNTNSLAPKTAAKTTIMKSMQIICSSAAFRRIRPVSARFQAFSGCHFHGMSSSMRLIL
jgi:hypothetical protein